MTTRVAIDIAKERITHIALRLQLDFSHLDRNLGLHCHLIIRVRDLEVFSRCRLLRARVRSLMELAFELLNIVRKIFLLMDGNRDLDTFSCASDRTTFTSIIYYSMYL